MSRFQGRDSFRHDQAHGQPRLRGCSRALTEFGLLADFFAEGLVETFAWYQEDLATKADIINMNF